MRILIQYLHELYLCRTPSTLEKLLWFLLLQVGKLLDSKGYGIAFTPGSLYRVPISSAILQLQVGIGTLLLD